MDGMEFASLKASWSVTGVEADIQLEEISEMRCLLL